MPVPRRPQQRQVCVSQLVVLSWLCAVVFVSASSRAMACRDTAQACASLSRYRRVLGSPQQSWLPDLLLGLLASWLCRACQPSAQTVEPCSNCRASTQLAACRSAAVYTRGACAAGGLLAFSVCAVLLLSTAKCTLRGAIGGEEGGGGGVAGAAAAGSRQQAFVFTR